MPWRDGQLRGFAYDAVSFGPTRVVRFILYVAGDTYRSQRAIANLRKLGNDVLHGRFDYAIVDVQRDPDAAERHRILTTPTLVKMEPGPSRRVTGDLTDFEQIMVALSLPPDEEDSNGSEGR